MGEPTGATGMPDSRLEALHRLRILDTDYEPPFDRIVRMVADFFDIPNVGIHLLDAERQWVKAFEGHAFFCARDESVCQFTLAHDDLLVIPDLREDPRTCNLGIVTGPPYLRFYAGMPLFTRDHQAVGTLCLIDTEPRPSLNARDEKSLQEFAGLVIETMELRVDYYHSQQALHTAVEFDATTGLMNRSSVVRDGQRLLDATPAPAGMAVIKIRLDRMNLVIRATGEDGRKAVVRAAAERLHDLIGPEDLLGRGDGNTFVLLRVRQQRDNGRQLEQWLNATSARILTRLAEPIDVDNQPINITASIGLARFADGSPSYRVIDAASAASLGSQDAGGNQARHFSAEAFSAYREQVSVEADLRAAVADTSFVVNYQPIVDMSASGRVVGAEALVRWPRDDQQSVGPDRFIPVAEEIGLIHDLGLWVFTTACRDLAAWHAQGWDLWISVNLSPVQLSDPTLVDKLVDRAQAAGVACHHIKLEITEGALATHFDEVSNTLERLRAAGFLLALDDFGTGHSSLARVIRMPFDTIKVDRGFVNDCPDGPGSAVVTSVAGLAKRLAINLVAEGVEHDHHERFLLDHAYTLAQGYYYARPMPSQAFSEHLTAAAILH